MQEEKSRLWDRTPITHSSTQEVAVHLDAAVLAERFDRGDEQEYQDYLEESHMPAIVEEADDHTYKGRLLTRQAVLSEELQRVVEK